MRHAPLPPRDATSAVLAAILILAGAPSLGAIVHQDERTPASGHGDTAAPAPDECRLAIELDPATGRLDGDATFTLAGAERLLTADGGLPIALDPRLDLELATFDGEPAPIERRAGDEAGPWGWSSW